MLACILLGLTSLASSYTGTPIDDPAEIILCGASGTGDSGNFNGNATGYSNGTDACRAAMADLVGKMFNATNASCVGCADTSKCKARIICDSATCTELTVDQPVEDPPDSDLWSCDAWYNGGFTPNCTDC